MAKIKLLHVVIRFIQTRVQLPARVGAHARPRSFCPSGKNPCPLGLRNGLHKSNHHLLLLYLTFLFLSTACDRSKPALRVFPDMDDQKIVKPQTRQMLPVEGTVARGQKPYPYKGNPDLAEQKLQNPLEATTDVLHRGQFMFNVYCLPCHNSDGKGMGPVVKRGFAPPPPLDSDRVKNWKDGRIFHIITDGQGIMPSYAIQIDPIDRWAIVNYVRVLQKTSDSHFEVVIPAKAGTRESSAENNHGTE